MCPLVSAPARGYADYQRLDNFDSGILYSANSQATTTSINSPIIDVSRYACVAGSMGIGSNRCRVIFIWYADAAGSVSTGLRQMFLDPVNNGKTAFRILNQGSFVSLQIDAIPLLQVLWSCQLFGSNRMGPLEFIPSGTWLINQQNIGIGGATTVSVPASESYAGPVEVAAWASNGNMQFSAQAYDNVSGNKTLITAWQQFTAATWTHVPFNAPAGYWEIAVNNLGAAGIYWLTVLPALTGSS